MGPPAKRRRQGASPFQEEEDDDDELSFQPQEVSARRDPGYKLSVKRANADHKLQATMAHIIEKYSRNFEGVGDEIDMETGEIVVNNGHLCTMRNEGDVGGRWMNMDEGEDEGMLLEDLIDDYSDNAEKVTEVQDSEDEEDFIMKGRELAKPSTSLVRAERPGAQIGRLSELFSNPYGGSFGGPNAGFGASPLGFGSSPFAFGPWGTPHDFGNPAWGEGNVPIQNRTQTKLLTSKAGEDRYDFPAQEGHKSIWAVGSQYELEDIPQRPSVVRTGFMKHAPKYPAKPHGPKQIGAPQPNENDDDDEDAILAGKPSHEDSVTSSGIHQGSEDEDDLMIESTASSRNIQRPSLSQTKGKMGTKDTTDELAAKEVNEFYPVEQNPKKRKRTSAGAALEELSAEKKQKLATEVQKAVTDDIDDDAGDRRRSGRVTKQVEYMGKISWHKADEERRAKQRLSVQLFQQHAAERADFESIDRVTDDATHSEIERSPKSIKYTSQGSGGKRTLPHIIPDSQETPPTSSALQETPTEEPPNYPSLISRKDGDASCGLSDDEAPVILQVLKAPKDQTLPKLQSLEPRPTETGLSISQESVELSLHQPRKPGRPKKMQTMSSLQKEDGTKEGSPMATPAEPLYINRPDETSPAEQRRSGRLRRSGISTSNAVGTLPDDATTKILASDQVHAPDEPSVAAERTQSTAVKETNQDMPKRRPGRPRKSVPVIPDANHSMFGDVPDQEITSEQVQDLTEAVLPTEITIRRVPEGNQTPTHVEKLPHLTLELRWLKSNGTKPGDDEAMVTPEVQETDSHRELEQARGTRNRLRSVRSRDIMKPSQKLPKEPTKAEEEMTKPPSPPPTTTLNLPPKTTLNAPLKTTLNLLPKTTHTRSSTISYQLRSHPTSDHERLSIR
ncbi:hypothetical protein G7046_g3055 [Stylonectria norvegica]|nr:hypothetical protein G7046_g3055 [Stylonectria norvegica]